MNQQLGGGMLTAQHTSVLVKTDSMLSINGDHVKFHVALCGQTDERPIGMDQFDRNSHLCI